MTNKVTARSRRVSVVAFGGSLMAASLLFAGPAQAATTTVPANLLDQSETRAHGHNDFGPSGVRVYTDGNSDVDGTTNTDKAAGYFDVDKTLSAVSSAAEPKMQWSSTNAITPATNLRPSIQLKTDFDGNGSIDGILVGEPTYADGSNLYGTVWWLSNGSSQFVKDGAPSHASGNGSDNNGTLAQWNAAFPSAKVIQSGWSLGSGVKGDGAILSISVAGDKYLFAPAAALTTKVLHSSDVNQSDTRANGHNEFIQTSGVEVSTDGNSDIGPRTDGGSGTWNTDKAAGYFTVNQSLASAGEPQMNYHAIAGSRPGEQLVVDFDNNGSPDGILVGEPSVYGTDWWLTNSAAQFAKDAAPSHGGGFGSANHGQLSEWRAAFPNAQILQGGWSLGSGAYGDGVIESITIGTTKYTFTGANVAPTAAPVTGSTGTDGSATVTLLGADADGDALTYSAPSVTHGTATIVGDQLTFNAASGFTGVASFGYTVSDGNGGTASSTVSITVGNRAPVAPGASGAAGFGHTAVVNLAATDPDGDAITYTVGASTSGRVRINKKHTVSFTPNRGFAGVATFPYTATDSHGASTVGTVTVLITQKAVAIHLGSSTTASTKQTFVRGSLAAPGANVNGGAITIKEGGVIVATGVVANSNFRLQVGSHLPVGAHTYTVSFGGTTNAAPKTATIVVTVH